MHIGTVTIEISNPFEASRSFDIEIFFGDTEVKVTACERGTRHSETARFDLV